MAANTWYNPSLGRSFELASGYTPPASEGWVQGSGPGTSGVSKSTGSTVSQADMMNMPGSFAMPMPGSGGSRGVVMPGMPASSNAIGSGFGQPVSGPMTDQNYTGIFWPSEPIITTPVMPPETAPGTTGGANTTALDPSQSTLSPNFAQYVYNMLGKAEGLASLPYQEYTGERFAEPSALQQQAFKGISALGPSLGTQAGIGAAATALGGLQNLQPYQAGSFGAPGVTAQQVSSTYQAPSAYTPANLQSTFQAPTPYQAGTFQTGYTPGTFTSGYTPGTIESGLGALKSIQEYMSPYQQSVIDIQAREARRQADISRAAEQARLAQAGAYGGSRQAIMEAERQRNLGQQIGDIQERGLQSAYDRALQQRLQEAQLGVTAQQAQEQARQFGANIGLEAQRAGEQAKQFGVTSGLQAQQAQEASRQFAAQQGMTAAQLQAQFGLDAAKANELSRQFGYQQQMTAQQLQAQFGLDAAKANQMAALQAATATQNAAMEAQRLQEQSRQFGAQYGLQGLQAQLGAASTLGTLGGQEFQQGLNALQAQLTAGEQQRKLEQEPLDFAYQQFQESMKYPYQQATYMQSLLQGLPLASRAYDPGQTSLAALLEGGLGGLSIAQLLGGKKD